MKRTGPRQAPPLPRVVTLNRNRPTPLSSADTHIDENANSEIFSILFFFNNINNINNLYLNRRG